MRKGAVTKYLRRLEGYSLVIVLLLFIFSHSAAFARDFSFVVISDTHFAHRKGAYELHRATEKIVTKIIGEIKPIFVIHCGDMLSIGPGTTNQQIWSMWEIFNSRVRGRLTKSGIPFFPTPGNHDMYDGGREIYAKIWKDFSNGKIPLDSGSYTNYYSFHYENCLFISCDGSGIVLPPNNITWLQEVLGKYSSLYEHKFVISHVGFLGKNRHPHDYLRNPGYDLLLKNGVEFLLCGHQHIYCHDKLGTMNHIICGSAGETYPYYFLLFTVKGEKVYWKVLSGDN